MIRVMIASGVKVKIRGRDMVRLWLVLGLGLRLL